MRPNFRHMARTALRKAKAKLSANNDDDLLYAALQLRMAMEALTYDRAVIYAEDLGPEQMKIWQPKQLLDLILEVDPRAGQAGTLSYGIEPSLGARPETMTTLGTDNVLSLATLKKHYAALGSYLHTPTLDQLEKEKPHDMSKLRCRCKTIVDAIEVVLSSEVWGVAIMRRGTIDCMRCGEKLRRRISENVKSRKVYCWKCGACYTMRLTRQQRVAFDPCQKEIPCVLEGCTASSYLWENDFQIGAQWDCHACGKSQHLALSVSC